MYKKNLCVIKLFDHLLYWPFVNLGIGIGIGIGTGTDTTNATIFSSIRARSLVVSDLRSETKGSRFESGCQLCAEVSSLQ